MLDFTDAHRAGPGSAPSRLSAGLLAAAVTALTATMWAPPARGAEGETASSTERLAPLRAELEAEIERAPQALARVRESEERLALARRRDEDEVRVALDRVAGLRVDLASTPPYGDGVDRLYESVTVELDDAWERVRAALDELSRPSEISGFRSKLDLEALRDSTLAARVTLLEQRISEIDMAVTEARRAEHDLRHERVRGRWAVVGRLNEVRIASLGRLSSAFRSGVLGLTTRTGTSQLRREIRHLILSARVYGLTLLDRLDQARRQSRDVFTIGAAMWAALKIAFVLALFIVIRARGAHLYERLRRALSAQFLRVAWRRRSEASLAVARIVGPWALVLACLWGLAWALGPAADWPETRLVLRLAAVYAFYRLTIDLFVTGGTSVIRRYRIEIGAARAVKLMRSVRLVLRVVFAVLVLLMLSAQLLGQGHLYHVVLRLAVILLAIALLLVFRSWKNDIVDAYLKRQGVGWLRRQVERTRDRWYGGFVAAGALLSLTGRAVLVVAGEFALGFDQTRRALAFLFLRRMEKQAERTGYAEPDAAESLPPALLELLGEEPIADERLRVDFFPGIDLLSRAAENWREHGRGGSFLLTGDLGVGRTSWLERVSVDGLSIDRVTFERRIDTDRVLGTVLGESLGLGDLGVRELGDKLLDLPPRMIVIDRGQNLFLGRVGGYRGFESFMSLVDSTTARVFWLVAFSKLAWDHIVAVHPQLAGFRGQFELGPWPEERIRELIGRRVAASGTSVIYDDILLDSLEGLPQRSRVTEAEAAYARLLWDQCMGLPRPALQYWRRSLVPQSEREVRVRLFRTPSVESLESGGDVPLFILGAIVVHESLTVREMSVVTRYPEPLCRIQVARLEDLGVVRRVGTRYWVTSYWHPTVARLLKRRNLVSD